MKYILVKDNHVFAGPNLWNPKLFESYIEDEFEITTTLPSSAPDNNTDLGNDITVYVLTDIQYPEYNAKIQKLNGPFYTFQDGNATQSFIVVDKSIDEVKSELLPIVAENRWKKEIAGVEVTVQSTVLKVTTQRGERDIFLQALQSGIDNAGWKLSGADGSTVWLTLSLAELQTIVGAIIAHIQSQFDWEKSTVLSIEACTTLAELDQIDLGTSVQQAPNLLG